MGEVNGRAQPVPCVRKRGVVPERPTGNTGRLRCQEIHDSINGKPRGDFPRFVSTHAIGNHTQAPLVVEHPAVFVDRPDAAFVGEAVRAQHLPVIGAFRRPYTSKSLNRIGSSAQPVIPIDFSAPPTAGVRAADRAQSRRRNRARRNGCGCRRFASCRTRRGTSAPARGNNASCPARAPRPRRT